MSELLTVAQWQARAGEHCQDAHRHRVRPGQVELGQVQADELWVKLVGKCVWMATAMSLASAPGVGWSDQPSPRSGIDHRVGSGGSGRVRGAQGIWSVWMAWRAMSLPFCECSMTRRVPGVVDGPGGWWNRVCSSAKRYARRRVVKVVRRVVQGIATALALALKATRGGTVSPIGR